MIEVMTSDIWDSSRPDVEQLTQALTQAAASR